MSEICPRCKSTPLEHETALNSLSRRDGKTYICNKCGDEEALIDICEMEPDKIEEEFVKWTKRT